MTTSGQTTGTLTGAGSGAVSGAMIGTEILPGWGTAIGAVAGAVIGGISGAISGGSADAQAENQRQWEIYNAQMGYANTLANIAASLGIADFNAQAALEAGKFNADMALSSAEYNAYILQTTTLYNADLLQDEIEQVWDGLDLDLLLLHQMRAVERGDIVNTISGSGVVIDEGSAKDVIIDQMTQEALDAFVIRHNADLAVKDIQNTIAQNMWEGQLAIDQTMWEGQQEAISSIANAQLSAMSTKTAAGISAIANRHSGQTALTSGLASADLGMNTYEQSQMNNLTRGLFNTTAQAISMYYGNKKAPSLTDTTTTNNAVAKVSNSSISRGNTYVMGSERSAMYEPLL